MEIYVADPATGDQHAVDVCESDTVQAVCNRAAAALGLDQSGGFVFSVNGAELTDWEEPAAGCEALCDGCVLEVLGSAAHYIDRIKGGAALGSLPAWVCDNEACVTAAVEHHYSNFADASCRLRGNPAFVLPLMKLQASVAQYVPHEVMADLGVVCGAPTNCFRLYLSNNPEACSDRDFMRAVLKNHASVLHHATAEVRNDPDLVFLAVQHGSFGGELAYASTELRHSHSFVLRCVESRGLAIDDAPDCMKDNEELVTASVKSNEHSFSYCSERLRSDRAFVLRLVRDLRSGIVLQQAADSIRSDEALLLEVLDAGIGIRLEQALDSIRDHREIVARAVAIRADDLRHASTRLQGDPDIVRAAVRQSHYALQHASPELRSSEAFFADLPVECLDYATYNVRHSRDSILRYVRVHNFRVLSNAPQHLRRNKTLVWEAVQIAWQAFAHAHRDLRGDAAFARRCVEVHAGCFAHVSRKLQQCSSLALLAVQTNGRMLAHCDAKLCNDREVVRTAVEAWPESFRHASPRLQARRDMVLHCVWSGGGLHLAGAHRHDPRVLLCAALREAPAFLAPVGLLALLCCALWAAWHCLPVDA